MAGYLGAIPVPQATQHRESFTATSGQTTFNTAGYTVGFLDVYLNGSHLSPADFTATNGSDVVLASGASTGDVCDIISYTAFEVNAQTFTGGLDVTGGITADGLTVDGGITTTVPTVTLDVVEESSNADGLIGLSAEGSSRSQIRSTHSLGSASDLRLITDAGGSAKDRLKIASNGDISFYEDTGSTAKLFWDASAESLGIGTSSPSAVLHVQGGSDVAFFDGTTVRLKIQNPSTGVLQLNSSGSGDSLSFATVDTEAMRIDSSGNVLVGNTALSTSYVSLRGGDNNCITTFRIGTGTRTQISFTNGTSGSSTEVGKIQTAGSSTSYNTSSDYRLKTDAQPMTGASARVQALNPVNFEWISDGTRVDGFLAHEAQAVVPECVTGTKDAMMDEEYQVSAATGDIYTVGVKAGFNEVSAAIEASPAYYDVDGNIIKAEVIAKAAVHEAYDAVDEVIHSADVEQPETLEDGQQWRETTPAVMGTRSVPDMQGIDQSKMVPLLVAALQEALARITALENA